MRASIRELGRDRDGKRVWLVTVNAGADGTGKRVRQRVRVHGSRQVADAEAARMLSDLSRGALIGRSLTVGRLLNAWLSDHVPQLEEATQRRYRSLARLHLAPNLRNLRVADLRQATLREYLERARSARFPERPLSDRTRLHLYRALIACLRWAAAEGYVSPVVAARLRAPHVERIERPALSGAQLLSLIDSLRGTALYMPAVIGATTGLRPGEICALRWRDVDLERARIRVRGSVTRTADGPLLKSTKTGRERIVPLPTIAVTELRAYRARQNETRLAAGEDWRDGDWVCSMEDGGLRLPDSLSGMWGKAMARRGLVGLHLHDLRHSYVSIRIHAHEDIATVAKRVGHSSPRTTAQHYAHAIEDAEQGDGDELLDAVFAAASGMLRNVKNT
jgi:integrase